MRLLLVMVHDPVLLCYCVCSLFAAFAVAMCYCACCDSLFVTVRFLFVVEAVAILLCDCACNNSFLIERHFQVRFSIVIVALPLCYCARGNCSIIMHFPRCYYVYCSSSLLLYFCISFIILPVAIPPSRCYCACCNSFVTAPVACPLRSCTCCDSSCYNAFFNPFVIVHVAMLFCYHDCGNFSMLLCSCNSSLLLCLIHFLNNITLRLLFIIAPSTFLVPHCLMHALIPICYRPVSVLHVITLVAIPLCFCVCCHLYSLLCKL